MLTRRTGHGWPIGCGVAWNGKFAQLSLQSPPRSTNWAIGTSGKTMPRYPSTGPLIHPDGPVAPHSLFATQLEQRLGSAAVLGVLNYAAGPPIPPRQSSSSR